MGESVGPSVFTRRAVLASGVAAALGSAGAGCMSASVPDVTVANATGTPLEVTVRVEGIKTTERTVTVKPDDPVKYPTILPDNAAATLEVEAENGVSDSYNTSGIGKSHGIYVTVRTDEIQFELSVV